MVLCIGFLNCKEANETIDTKISVPFETYHVSPEMCTANNWDVRNFSFPVPDNYKLSQVTSINKVNYVNIEGDNVWLNIGAAEIDLDLSLILTDVKLNGDSQYNRFFNKIQPLLHNKIIEPNLKEIYAIIDQYPEVQLISRNENDKIIINDIPSNYSEITVMRKENDKEIWQHNVLFILPNIKNLNQSLYCYYTFESYNNKYLNKSSFIKSDVYKIVSNINFL